MFALLPWNEGWGGELPKVKKREWIPGNYDWLVDFVRLWRACCFFLIIDCRASLGIFCTETAKEIGEADKGLDA